MSASFTYDDATPDSAALADTGQYFGTLNGTMTIGSYVATITNGMVEIANDRGNVDSLSMLAMPGIPLFGSIVGSSVGGLSVFAAALSLSDNQASAFDSDALQSLAPLGPDLGMFEFRRFFLGFMLNPDADPVFVGGELSSLAIARVTEPGTLALLALGLFVTGAGRARVRPW